jgi:YegS/Rv2252/BmrU family lipid kinase
MQVTLVINPRAGENLAKLSDILPIFAAAGWSTNLALKEPGARAMDLATRATEKGDDLVIAYGGDGTLNQVVNGVMHVKGQHSTVGLVPGGTTNVWAGEIGVPGDPVKAALTLVDSDARKVDIGHVEVEELSFPEASQNEYRRHGKQKRKRKTKSSVRDHFLLMAGLGIDAAVMRRVSKPMKFQVGPLAVGLSAVKELPAQHPFPVEIRAGDLSDAGVLWKGEAIQVVIGNTRHYAGIVEMTPDAYIDDGMLDVCVITAGNPLTTLQQLVSLLARRKPDQLTAEYFHGAHLSISVPASIALQLDGSAVKLKDLLTKSDRKALSRAGNAEQVMVTYRFDAMPRALQVAIPRAYDDTLFRESGSADHQQAETAQMPAEEQKELDIQQQRDEASQDRHQYNGKQPEQDQHEPPERVQALFEQGRKVTVVGASTNPVKQGTYIVAGRATKQSSGEARPVAVRINKNTTVIGQAGEDLPPAAVLKLHEGETMIVEGKKSKRGVIRAGQVVIEADVIARFHAHDQAVAEESRQGYPANS